MVRGFDQETTLGVCWSKKENDWMIYYPEKPDGWMMNDFIKSDVFQNFIGELNKRGYDTDSLRFSVKKEQSERN